MLNFLIVDDEPTSRLLLQNLLCRYGRCDQAHDGHEAVAAYRIARDAGRPYDLICLDIMMPGMDGHQALKMIREIERERHIFGTDGVPVLMLTCSGSTSDCILAFSQGCEGYVAKPVEEKTLMPQVRRLLPGRLKDDAEARPAPVEEKASDPLVRCLIVDDDRVCRELLRDMLQPVAECDFAYDGSEAVDVVRLAIEDGTPYELICLDIMMPCMDGHQTLSAIRTIEGDRGIRCQDGVKVIMTTALRDSKHCIQSFREGCECYVTKPVNRDELFEKLRYLNLLAERGLSKV
ncbi:MAG: response regulator [Thermoguttaceae bacterium]